MLNIVYTQFRQIANQSAADVLPGGTTFENVQLDPNRIMETRQAAQIAVAVKSDGVAVVTPYWRVKTADTDLGWFKDVSQQITVNGGARDLGILNVKGGQLMLWVESISTGAVMIYAAEGRAGA